MFLRVERSFEAFIDIDQLRVTALLQSLRGL